MRSVFTVALLLALSGQSRAEIMAAPSIEWLSCQSDVIVVGKLEKIAVIKGPGDVIYEDCTVQIGEVVKGDIKGKELVFCLRTLSSPEPSVKALMNSRQEVLLFLSKSEDHGGESHLDNMYVPTSMLQPFSVINLSDVPKDLYGKDMTVLADPKVILKIVRTWAHSKISHSLWSEVPYASPVFKQLYAGSSCYLIVPAEESYRPYFLKLARSGNQYERQRAAEELYKFPGEETEAVLRELLADKTENVWTFSADTIWRIEYGVRAAAYNSLKALGKPVPQIELERKPTDAEQRSRRQGYWQKSFAEALRNGWKVISVEDGITRQVEDRDTVSVVVTCGKGDSRCRFTLVPKEWDRKDYPPGESIGIDGRHSQGARQFFVDGNMPKDLKDMVIEQFGLETF